MLVPPFVVMSLMWVIMVTMILGAASLMERHGSEVRHFLNGTEAWSSDKYLVRSVETDGGVTFYGPWTPVQVVPLVGADKTEAAVRYKANKKVGSTGLEIRECATDVRTLSGYVRCE